MKHQNVYLLVFIIAGLTFFFRSIPFIFYRYIQNNETLAFIRVFLPAGIMLVLTIYTLKDVSLTSFPYGLSEMIAVATVIFLHVTWRNALLSIAMGTIVFIICKHLCL